jgi:hypothetical protein
MDQQPMEIEQMVQQPMEILQMDGEPLLQENFLEVENFFRQGLSRIPNLNICCSPEEREFLFNMAIHLKSVFPFISSKDICIAIIFTYYGLVLGEQTEDYLKTNSYNGYADNSENVTNLYIEITTGDIMLNGQNLSSAIRRHMLGLRGGKRKSRRTRRSKSYKKNKKGKGINYKKSKKRRIRNKNKK